ncbi:MAG TPA: histidine phosphatase family protein [Smithellaceae bacterium]|nr:histidine phosphatase family protein [Smithellaceae bacterium]
MKDTSYSLDMITPTTIVLMRHAERGPLPKDNIGHDVPITLDGRAAAEELGRQFGSRLASISTSPVLRCRQTAEAICLASGTDLPIHVNKLIGGVGAIVSNTAQALQSYLSMEAHDLVASLARGTPPVPGFYPISVSIPRIINTTIAHSRGVPGLHLFITHDVVIVLTLLYLLEEPFKQELWPDFLEQLTLQYDRNVLTVSYRQRRQPADINKAPEAGLCISPEWWLF